MMLVKDWLKWSSAVTYGYALHITGAFEDL